MRSKGRREDTKRKGVEVEEVKGKEMKLKKDGPGPVLVSDTLCPAAHI